MTIPKLLAALAVLALLLAPLARPAMAMPAVMHATMGDHASMEMTADMPCCPEKAPVPDCAKGCPLMAMCAAGSLQYMPTVSALVVPFTLASVVIPANGANLDGLTQRPPPRPPKA